jgi:hypothetical protein
MGRAIVDVTYRQVVETSLGQFDNLVVRYDVVVEYVETPLHDRVSTTYLIVEGCVMKPISNIEYLKVKKVVTGYVKDIGVSEGDEALINRGEKA